MAQVANADEVNTLGHSAGGHLAAWAGARTRFERWAGGVPVSSVVSLAGVLDLGSAHAARLGDDAVQGLMRTEPSDPTYDLADPTRQLPLEARLWAVHARDDEDVPFAQSQGYVAASSHSTLVEVSGGHFGLVDVRHPAWARVVEVLDAL